MSTYRVAWLIDLEADSPVDAARQALEIQRDPESLATVFRVSQHLKSGELSRRVYVIDTEAGGSA